MRQTEIRIENARAHNLKGVSCRIPLGALTVVTGVSGSGKSSLAFDTLYAEGQRRYVTSLSTYARQFLERLPRPAVDAISSLPPAIAIEQRNRVRNARSTVGTSTELLDHLRLLFANAGRTHCPDCDRFVLPGGVTGVSDRLAERFAGRRLTIAVPIVRAKRETAKAWRDRLASEGYTRVVDATGRVVDLVETPIRQLTRLLGESLLLIDRLALRVGADGEDLDPDARTRLGEAVSQAFVRGDGDLVALVEGGEGGEGGGGAESAERVAMREGFSCEGCGRVFPLPEPARFSWNSPLGACAPCQGFGRTAEIDPERVVPDPSRSLERHAIAPFATPTGRGMERDLLAACRQVGVATDVAWSDLTQEDREWVMQGDEDEWYGVQGFFDWLDGRRYKVQVRVLIARYRRFVTCTECLGTRLTADALTVLIDGRHIGEVSAMTIAQLRGWLEELALAPAEALRSQRILEALRTRVATVAAVGLGYIGLDRPMRTLSGGEAQRIQLATALGGGLTASLYVLDEPSIGLHARDMQRLIEVMLAIRDQGNTVVVVEHAPEILAVADHVIDLGPAAGRLGGELLVEGTLEAVRSCEASQTGRLLRGELNADIGTRRRRPAHAGRLRVIGASENNLVDLDVDIPLHRLVAVTGVSGAGKSTLIQSVLVGNLLPVSERKQAPGACRGIEGVSAIRGVVVVDQTPAVRSPRSNPATVSKAFDGIRQRFAATREARALGVGPGFFSFNVQGGRCDLCEGAGEVVIDMQFLDDVRVPCDDCGGTRYRRDAQEIRLDGRSIVDVLAMTLDEAAEVFVDERKIAGRLEPFRRVGLGYLTLGQPLSTLSGGEHQRVRLALALGEPAEGKLYVLDEPTTGLHAADVHVLLDCLDELVKAGGSVLVIEHNLAVLRRADWIIDLGPDGGPGGGRLVAEGAPEAIAAVKASLTGAALREEFMSAP
ncbi:MAG: excinuclease ABC subunit UvrA [Deltaproteobacteria bacterium]|nr:excinuclease ABC subunit UvrA [Deltaproteobacteria bacterium]